MNWIVTEVFYPDEVSTALIMSEIAEELVKNGKIGVICGPVGYEKSYISQSRPLNPAIDIKRVNVGHFDKNKLLTRVIRLLLLTLKMSFSVLRNVKKGDSVLMVTNPAFLLVTIALLKRIKRIKLNILVHDIFPDNLLPAGLIKQDSIKYKLLNAIFNWAYKKADKLIVLGEDMKVLMEAKLEGVNQKITIIPNWCDSEIYPIPDFSASSYFNLPLDNKIVIGFAGNLGRVQGIPEFLELFIKADNEHLAMVLIGDGAMKEAIEKKLWTENVKNIFLVGARSRSEQLNFLNGFDIALITLKSGMKGLGVPSKAYNVMAAQKPIFYIGDKDSENDRYVKTFDNGWSFGWNEPESIIAFLRSLSIDSKSVIKIKGTNALEAAKANFQKADVLCKFNHL